MKTGWVMVNVVWYDGCDAYVSKFVLRFDKDAEVITDESKEKLLDYMISAGGELLKTDVLYSVDLEEIIALKQAEQPELKAAFDRFNTMWF